MYKPVNAHWSPMEALISVSLSLNYGIEIVEFVPLGNLSFLLFSGSDDQVEAIYFVGHQGLNNFAFAVGISVTL